MNSEEFIALAPERQRAYVDPTTAEYFTRIYYSDGDLKAVVTHWPSKVEVSKGSMTTSLATCFGMFASLMRASISEEELTLVVTEFPDYMWLTIKDLTMQAQEWLKNASNKEWCDILAECLIICNQRMPKKNSTSSSMMIPTTFSDYWGLTAD